MKILILLLLTGCSVKYYSQQAVVTSKGFKVVSKPMKTNPGDTVTILRRW